MRNALLRLVAAVLAAAALVFPGFGIPDLLVTWNPAWQVVLEAGWGLFMTVLVAVPLLTVAVAPGRAGPAVVQLWTASGCLLLAAALAADHHAALLGVGLLAGTAAVSALRAGRPRLREGLSADRPLLVVAALGAVPWLAYASGQAAADRRHLPDTDITVGVDHHAVQGALALALVVVPLLAASWEPGRRYLATCAGLAAAYLALVALAHPVTPAGFGRAWAASALAWALALVAAGRGWRADGRRVATTGG